MALRHGEQETAREFNAYQVSYKNGLTLMQILTKKYFISMNVLAVEQTVNNAGFPTEIHLSKKKKNFPCFFVCFFVYSKMKEKRSVRCI